MKNYDTLSEAINDLAKRGYTYNFNLESDCVHCVEVNQKLSPKEFEIDEFYRFEGETDPGDENIVYAISALGGKIKGVLVSAYGTYSESFSSDLISKLSVHPHS